MLEFTESQRDSDQILTYLNCKTHWNSQKFTVLIFCYLNKKDHSIPSKKSYAFVEESSMGTFQRILRKFSRTKIHKIGESLKRVTFQKGLLRKEP